MPEDFLLHKKYATRRKLPQTPVPTFIPILTDTRFGDDMSDEQTDTSEHIYEVIPDDVLPKPKKKEIELIYEEIDSIYYYKRFGYWPQTEVAIRRKLPQTPVPIVKAIDKFIPILTDTRFGDDMSDEQKDTSEHIYEVIPDDVLPKPKKEEIEMIYEEIDSIYYYKRFGYWPQTEVAIRRKLPQTPVPTVKAIDKFIPILTDTRFGDDMSEEQKDTIYEVIPDDVLPTPTDGEIEMIYEEIDSIYYYVRFGYWRRTEAAMRRNLPTIPQTEGARKKLPRIPQQKGDTTTSKTFDITPLVTSEIRQQCERMSTRDNIKEESEFDFRPLSIPLRSEDIISTLSDSILSRQLTEQSRREKESSVALFADLLTEFEIVKRNYRRMPKDYWPDDISIASSCSIEYVLSSEDGAHSTPDMSSHASDINLVRTALEIIPKQIEMMNWRIKAEKKKEAVILEYKAMSLTEQNTMDREDDTSESYDAL
ncbi:uncharacterized protein LOC116341242 [Contarinia nasturtii]|uniref:uncharacterized protein LOC116341242 n=1 Tax=Contarinia nasturtii TaxID=265458 RepID=UPI0012D43E40|nr:uncharacterized protein LOC116341242 [Contarinia nasturtii]